MFQKLGLSVVSLMLHLVPFWFFLVVKALASPEGQTYQLVVLGWGYGTLVFLQVILLIWWCFMLFLVWTSTHYPER